MPQFSGQSDELAPMSEEEKQAGEMPPQPASETTTPGESVQEPEEKPVVKLSKPSKELAKKLLGIRVSFEDRLIGIRENPEAGEEPDFIYTFEEAVQYLLSGGDDSWEGSDWMYSIDSRDLQKWVGKVLGDKEIAKAIEDEIEKCTNYIEHVRFLKSIEQKKKIKELMAYRLEQCKELITEEAEA